MVVRVAAAGQPDAAVDHRELPRRVFDTDHLAAEQHIPVTVAEPSFGIHFVVRFHHQYPLHGTNDLPFHSRYPMKSRPPIDANLI